MTAVTLEADRRDQIAALASERDYRAAATTNRALATELRDRDFNAIADQLDAAADIAEAELAPQERAP